MAVTPKLRVTPTSARVGDKLVVKATGVGGPTASSLTVNTTGANSSVLVTANDFFAGANGTMPQLTMTAGATGTTFTTVPVGSTGVTGHAVSVILSTDASAVINATANDVIAAINNDSRANQILTASLGGTALGNGLASAIAQTSLAGGANANTTGPASVRIYHESNPGDVVGETLTISKEGVVDSTGDFTYETDRPGYVHIDLINSTGAVADTARIQIFTS